MKINVMISFYIGLDVTRVSKDTYLCTSVASCFAALLLILQPKLIVFGIIKSISVFFFICECLVVLIRKLTVGYKFK